MSIYLISTPKIIFLFDIPFIGNTSIIHKYGYILSFDGGNILIDSIQRIIPDINNKRLYLIYLHSNINKPFIYDIYDPYIKIYLGIVQTKKKFFNFGLKLNNTKYKTALMNSMRGSYFQKELYLISQSSIYYKSCFYKLNITYDYKNFIINGAFYYNFSVPMLYTQSPNMIHTIFNKTYIIRMNF